MENREELRSTHLWKQNRNIIRLRSPVLKGTSSGYKRRDRCYLWKSSWIIIMIGKKLAKVIRGCLYVWDTGVRTSKLFIIILEKDQSRRGSTNVLPFYTNFNVSTCYSYIRDTFLSHLESIWI